MSKVTNTFEAARKFGIGYLHTNASSAVFEGITTGQEQRLITAVGSAYCTDSNPCGVAFYYDLDTPKPFRIADDQHGESFATFAELLACAESWSA